MVPLLLWAAMCITRSPWAHLLCCPWILWAHMAVLGSAHLTPTLVFLSAAPMVPHRLTLEPGQDLISTALCGQSRDLVPSPSSMDQNEDSTHFVPGGKGKRERGTLASRGCLKLACPRKRPHLFHRIPRSSDQEWRQRYCGPVMTVCVSVCVWYGVCVVWCV